MKTGFLVLCSILLCFSCKRDVDKEELEAELLTLHQNLIRAHLTNDPGLSVQNLSENFASVKNGNITFPDREEILSGITDYVSNTTFSEYRDLQEPVVGLSEDGTVGWIIARVSVSGIRKLNDGTTREVSFICSWMTLYRRIQGSWVTEAEVSTFGSD
ncbi:MAG: hypothetical protein MUE37_10350 [Bacteroidales bacterium]|jgi:hypothetical protein|nr:hypothetical protein [Bacteroidales bacterium]